MHEPSAPEQGRGQLAGRRILVVGAGQQDHGLEDPPIGNGRAMSVLFAREGAAVALTDIDADSLRVTEELVRAEGAECVAVVADAAEESGIEAAFAGGREALGGLDGLVMNVGIGAGMGFGGTSVEDWDRVMAVNLRSHFLGCRQALACFEDRSTVVLIGSLAARESMPVPSYAASKAALEAVCRNAAVEGAPGIRVNVLAPGLIDTSLGRLATQLNPARAEVRIPAGRHGSAWEVARCAVFLSCEDSSYVTGQTLIADGGLSVAVRG
ncbi:MAG TPA: SDR family oxidoreductase [Solirubrobacteraceae bacterium]|nr:SDR family oxidoreductase [Solirubrobacteraceae bacterium]